MKYMVLFKSETAGNPIKVSGVSGGPQGATDKGILAVYDVPDSKVQQFEAAVQGCAEVVKSQPLGSGQTK